MKNKTKERMVEEIQESDEYKTFKRILKRARDNLDLERDKKECLALHASRTARNLYGKGQFNPSKVADAQTIDMNARSRMVEIRVKAKANLSVIEKAVKAMKHHISSSYSTELAAYRTKDQREAFLNNLLRKAQRTIDEGEALIELIDFLLKDLDQTSYGLKNLVEVLKLLNENAGRVV